MKTISRRARQSTVTLYNYLSTTSGVATYQRTVLDRVYLDTGYAQRLAQRGISTTDKAQLIVELRDSAITGNRKYIDPVAWGSLTNKAGYFTFNPANDFFVQGDASETLPSETKTTMQKKYQVYSISNVAAPTSDVLQIYGK